MPALNQDLIRLENDSFVLKFTATDGTIGSNYAAWWGLSDSATAVVNSSPLIQAWTKSSGGGENVSSYSATTGNGCSAGGTFTLNASDSSNPAAQVFTNFVQIQILNENVFDAVPDGDYYHELVLMDVESNVGMQCKSHVAASGILTVHQSIFTNKPYRT